MPIRIATAPVSWGILEVEGWARQQTYGEVLDQMVQAGYTGTELGPFGFLPTDPRELKRELGIRNLSLLGAFVPLPLGHPERQQEGLRSALEIARLLAANGAPYIVLADEMSEARMAIAGRAGREDGFTEAQWESAAKLLWCIARTAGEYGVRSVFHHHAGTHVETPDEVARLLRITDPTLLGICLDTGHYLYGGGDPVEFARAQAPRIWHLHLKDIRANVLAKVALSEDRLLDAIRCRRLQRTRPGQCGSGRSDPRASDAAGFDGWAVFEQDVDPTVPGTDPLTECHAEPRILRRMRGSLRHYARLSSHCLRWQSSAGTGPERAPPGGAARTLLAADETGITPDENNTLLSALIRGPIVFLPPTVSSTPFSTTSGSQRLVSTLWYEASRSAETGLGAFGPVPAPRRLVRSYYPGASCVCRRRLSPSPSRFLR